MFACYGKPNRKPQIIEANRIPIKPSVHKKTNQYLEEPIQQNRKWL